MKKILTLAVALVAIASQAASIDWSMTFGARTIKDSAGAKMASGAAYLVLASDVATIKASKTADASGFLASLASNALATSPISAGKGTVASGTASSDKLVAGTSYTFQFLIFDSTLNEYYLSPTVTESAYDAASDDMSLQTPLKITFAASDMGATSGTTANPNTFSSAVKAGGDDPVGPAVPEPATGALALAGLALLFRRRRA